MRQLFLLLALAVSACASTDVVHRDVGTDDAINLIGKKVQLLDVRTEKEWDNGRLEGATRIDISKDGFTEKAVANLDKSQPLLIYCHSGWRSADAAKRLGKAGFTKLYNLKGGIKAWTKDGQKVVK